jgi:hypothetical protein
VHGMAFRFKIEAKPLREMCFVFDHQNAAHARYTRGKRIVKVLPNPSPWLSA